MWEKAVLFEELLGDLILFVNTQEEWNLQCKIPQKKKVEAYGKTADANWPIEAWLQCSASLQSHQHVGSFNSFRPLMLLKVQQPITVSHCWVAPFQSEEVQSAALHLVVFVVHLPRESEALLRHHTEDKLHCEDRWSLINTYCFSHQNYVNLTIYLLQVTSNSSAVWTWDDIIHFGHRWYVLSRFFII